MFYKIEEDPSISMTIKEAATHLGYTLPLVLFYQGLRLLSLFVQSNELVSPQPSSFRDSHDNRVVNLIDYLIFFLYLVPGRKHNKIKIDSFKPISLFFLSADAKASPKERKAKYFSKFIQFVKTVCFRPDTI